MSTLITHHPSDPSRDDDPTGVRDLLSALPQPGPMPGYLVERINASLAAEQAQRAAAPGAASLTPLFAPTRRRAGRIVFAVAGAAAAVALFAVVGSNIFQPGRSTTVSGSAGAPVTARAPAAGGQGLTNAEGKPGQTSRQGASTPSATLGLVQILVSQTQYTRAGFVTQAGQLDRATINQNQPHAQGYAEAGPVATTPGLVDCLNAIGARGAQAARADLSFYEGRPAAIIVVTTNGTRTAYAVGRQCSHADAAVLRPATPLP